MTSRAVDMRQAATSAAAQAIKTMITTLLVLVLTAAWWALKKTWRRLFPFWWASAAVGCAAILATTHPAWWVPILVACSGIGVATCWPTARIEVRAYRILTAAVMLTIATAGPALTDLPAVAIAAVCVAPVLGWPWWHHLRTWRPTVDEVPEEPEIPVDDLLTAEWKARWESQVIAAGILKGTALVAASSPRRHVIDAKLQLKPGTKIAEVVNKGEQVATCLEDLDLDEGSVGFGRTGKVRYVVLSIVRRSYIAGGVTYRGPTWIDERGERGRIQVMTYADGTAGWWTSYRDEYGTPNGLVVGSTGSGKSRALGVIIDSLLNAGIPTVIGDSQEGQSLPAWRDAASEYHQGQPDVTALILRYEAEVMARSKLLGEAGVEAFDMSDPRVQRLGLTPIGIIIDECQLVLVRDTKAGKIATAAATRGAATGRKTGVFLILATQLPQMESLGGSNRLRDALVAGNTMVLRVSNKGSGATILPDDFPGDPFTIPEEIDGKTTAGTGYLRSGGRMGMLARVPKLDEKEAAANAPHVPVRWLVDPVEVDDDDGLPVGPGSEKLRDAADSDDPMAAMGDKLAQMFGVNPPSRPGKTDTRGWVMQVLRSAPQSTTALLARPDCPVSKPQLHAVLNSLVDAGKLIRPERGESWTVAP